MWGYLDIAVQDVGRMHKLECLEHLIDNIGFVDLFQDVGANDAVEV